jgi:predicted phosphodiesterase
MRIICISDTHSLHKEMNYNIQDFIDSKQDNILLHSGDCTNVGKEKEINDFVHWFQNIKGFDNKIFIAGNHDFGFEYYNGVRHHHEAPWLHHLLNEENLSQSDVTYLHDSGFTIESPEFSKPIKIWGSPWQPEFFNWAFNLPRGGNELKEKWDMIPDDTDILITHGPPHGIRDFIEHGKQNVGCGLLRLRTDVIKPKIHVFGHIHSAYGSAYINGTAFINASICTERYIPSNKPIVLDLKEIDGIFVVELVDM